jgi:spore germination protein KB
MKKYEQVIISFILSKALFFGIAMSFIINYAGNMTWLAIILGYLLGYIILKLFMHKNIYNIYHTIIGKITMLILLLFTLSIILIAYTLQTSNFYLPLTPPFIIAFMLISILFYGFNKGFDTIIRYTDIVIILAIVLIAIGLFGNINMFDITNFLPIIIKFNYPFILSVLAVMIISITPLIIFMSIKIDYDSKALLLGYLLGGLIILLEVLMTIGTLGVTLASIYRYPVYIAFKKIKMGIFFERIENILAAIWFIDFSVLGMIIMTSLNKIIKNHLIIYIICLIMGYFISQYIINIYQSIIYLYHYLYYILDILIVIIYLITKKAPLKDANS